MGSLSAIIVWNLIIRYTGRAVYRTARRRADTRNANILAWSFVDMEPITIHSEETVDAAGPSVSFRDQQSRYLLAAAACLILTCAVYWPSFVSWYHGWVKEESYYSHGILVPFICIGLIWLKRRRLAGVCICPDPLGYLLVVPSLIITVVLTWAGGTSAQGFTFPVMLSGLVLILFGREMLRELAFPVGYIYFMIVLPGFILTMASFRVQMMSTIGASGILKLMGFDVYREGQFIHLPNVDVEVATACSGFKLLISLYALTTLFAYVKQGPVWGKASLLVLMVPLSVALNSLRIAMVALVGEYMGTDAMQGFHDRYAGVIMLAMAFTALHFLSRLLRCERLNSTLTS